MNSQFFDTLQSIAATAVHSSLLVGVAALAQRFILAPRARRFAWITCFAALLVVAANAFVGLIPARSALRTNPPPARSEHGFRIRNNITEASPATVAPAADPEAVPNTPSPIAAQPEPPHPWLSLWPVAVWLGGTAILFSRIAASALFLLTRPTAASAAPPDSLAPALAQLASRLGLSAELRWRFLPGAASPAAFGLVRPTIGLPPGFWSRFAPDQIEVMLAHEFAHLASRDPLALLVIDAVTALLWWQPLAWFARRQFRIASEATADLSSLELENGPCRLAETLVTLAACMPNHGSPAAFNMAGLQSRLGERVEALLALAESPSQSNTSRLHGVRFAAAAVILSSLGLVVLLQFSFPSAIPKPVSTLAAPLFSRLPLIAKGLPSDPSKTRESREASPGTVPASIAPAPPAQRSASTVNPPEKSSPPEINAGATPTPAPPETTVPITLPPSDRSATGLPSEPKETLVVTRVFRVDPRQLATFADAIQLPRLPDSPDPSQPGPQVIDWIRRLLAATDPSAASNPADPARPPLTMIYNSTAERLYVRATPEELERLEKALNRAAATPPQVKIEARFVEISLPENQIPSSPAPARNGPSDNLNPSAPKRYRSVVDMLQDSQLQEVFTALESSPPTASRELRGNEFDWPGRSVSNSPNIRITAAEGTQAFAILDRDAHTAALAKLQGQPAASILSAPQIITLSGRRAQIEVTEVRSIPTGFHVTTNVSFDVHQLSTGPVLDIKPDVQTNGKIRLDVSATFTEFLGYDRPPKGAETVVLVDGKSTRVAPPLPRFRVRKTSTQQVIDNHQTLVFESLPVVDQIKMVDKVPTLGDIPILGRLFRSESTSKISRRLLVFVTAYVVDPAGEALPVSSGPKSGAPGEPSPK